MRKILLPVLLVVLMWSAQGFSQAVVIDVADFKNEGDKRYGYLGNGISRTVEADLSSHANITVVTSETRERAIRELELVQMGLLDKEIGAAELAGADYIAAGSFGVERGEFRITTKLIEVRTKRIIESLRITGPFEQIQEKQQQIAANLIRLLEGKGLLKQGTVKESPGSVRAPRAADAYRYYCIGLENKQGDPRLALSYFQKAVNADPSYIEAIIECAEINNDYLSRYDSAADYIAGAEKTLQDSYRTQSVPFAMVMGLKGRIFFNMSQKDAAKLNVALQSYLSGMNVLEHVGRKKSFVYSEILNDYGIALKKRGKFGESVSAFREALDIKKELGMDSNVFYAVTLHNLANVYFSAGERRKALDLCRRSLALKERLGLSPAKTYAVSLNTLGVMCCASNNHDEAITAFNHSAKIFANLGLKRTADYATNRANAAFAFRAKKEFREARSLYLEAQSIRERLGLENSLDYAQTGLDLAGMLHADMNDPCAALEHAARALSVKKRFLPVTGADSLMVEQIRAACSR